MKQLGGECVDCGSTSHLEFDHVNPDVKSATISTILLHSWTKILAELAKCTLRCSKCHRGRTVIQAAVEHGGGASGKKNCKCGLCRKKKSEYMKNWKQGLRAGAQAGLANRP